MVAVGSQDCLQAVPSDGSWFSPGQGTTAQHCLHRSGLSLAGAPGFTAVQAAACVPSSGCRDVFWLSRGCSGQQLAGTELAVSRMKAEQPWLHLNSSE